MTKLTTYFNKNFKIKKKYFEKSNNNILVRTQTIKKNVFIQIWLDIQVIAKSSEYDTFASESEHHSKLKYNFLIDFVEL